MIRILLCTCLALIVGLMSSASPTRAQSGNPDDVVWVQVEAQPSLNRATGRAQDFARTIEDVNGFAVGGGWYAIVVGPYRRADAELVLRQYRRDGLIPRDSFIQTSNRLRSQFWPVGANVLGTGAITAPGVPAAPTETTQAEPETPPQASTPQPDPEPAVVDETPAEARRSERALSAAERRELQVMLQWAGYYNAAIDGAFGRGTRGSMAQWQAANGFETTGVLTTLQRATLKEQYNAVLRGMDLRRVRDAQAGIEVLVPTGAVAFDRYEPPFAHYEATGDLAARVLLISQPGDQNTLFGLYEIMQTLEIVPLQGARERRDRSFTLVGENARFISYTEAALQDGEIKGFTLIWPAGDEERRRRILGEMRRSFARLPGVLSPGAGTAAEQSIDLVSGLQIRKPIRARSGFFVTADGAVATVSEAVQNCSRITIDGDTDAALIADDRARGVALLRPDAALAPLAVAALSPREPRLKSEVAVAGYSFGGVLSAPSSTFGTLADVRGLNGEDSVNRLALKTRAGDAGGPVLGEDGEVIGMVAPRMQDGTQLPDDVSFALDAATVAAAGAEAGLTLAPSTGSRALTPFQITERASGMTVLVSCWE
ncbi:trypsin-like peptidase domain-containing protein [Sulfitobacter albidus]|uniref:Trypsin-like peptidase domain-containing protein n=1 Tax=Sulfitobacter albidus TaxID=2829501 RepID=A0A975JES1_9RHOB|nr:trypsin-like peptidase domain-containing protein [Sulfitobacter albidus]QUJ77176.1 trypsin-like peptidase domain-containing protein [Sulfitobacter albidus]